jgi:dihydroorotase
MRRALAYAHGFDMIIVQHPEEPSLAGGAATEGARSTLMGLPGIPACAESLMVARDLRLVELTGGAIHFAHISTAESLDLIRRAKHAGLRVTCDTAPPYFDLNETAIGDFRTYAKLSPPLRPEADRRAVCDALADGTIDAIASDHQPRDADDKRLPFAEAAPGGAGLPTLLAITLAQVHNQSLPLMTALSLLTNRPAALFGLDRGADGAGRIARGRRADLCLFALDRAWRIEAGRLPGKAQNTPFDGRAVEGVVVGTWKAGLRVFG